MYSGSSNVVLKMFLIVFAWEVAMYQRRLTDSFFFLGGGGVRVRNNATIYQFQRLRVFEREWADWQCIKVFGKQMCGMNLYSWPESYKEEKKTRFLPCGVYQDKHELWVAC